MFVMQDREPDWTIISLNQTLALLDAASGDASSTMRHSISPYVCRITE
jgi:hypothetical protein